MITDPHTKSLTTAVSSLRPCARIARPRAPGSGRLVQHGCGELAGCTVRRRRQNVGTGMSAFCFFVGAYNADSCQQTGRAAERNGAKRRTAWVRWMDRVGRSEGRA